MVQRDKASVENSTEYKAHHMQIITILQLSLITDIIQYDVRVATWILFEKDISRSKNANSVNLATLFQVIRKLYRNTFNPCLEWGTSL